VVAGPLPIAVAADRQRANQHHLVLHPPEVARPVTITGIA